MRSYEDPIAKMEPGAINLDGMTLEELAIFKNSTQGMYQSRAAGKMFKGIKGAKKTVKALNDYAWNKAHAMNCRILGDIQTAMKFESKCYKIWCDLPEYARW